MEDLTREKSRLNAEQETFLRSSKAVFNVPRFLSIFKKLFLSPFLKSYS